VSAPKLRVVTDPDAELRRLRLVEARVVDLLDCIDLRTKAGWHKVPRPEVEALRAALNGDPDA
jgi:hypothetical protein